MIISFPSSLIYLETQFKYRIKNKYFQIKMFIFLKYLQTLDKFF